MNSLMMFNPECTQADAAGFFGHLGAVLSAKRWHTLLRNYSERISKIPLPSG